MENRIVKSNLACSPPRKLTNINFRSNGLGSPKLFKRKPAHKLEGPLEKSRRDSVQSSIDSAICYISPRKNLEHSRRMCDSKRSLVSAASLENLSVDFGRSPNEYTRPHQHLDANSNLSVIDNVQPKTEETKEQNNNLKGDNDILRQQNHCLREQNDGLRQQNDSLRQKNDGWRRQNDKLKQENTRLKHENENLKQVSETARKELKQKDGVLKQLLQENSYFYTKMEEFNSILLQKNEIIQKMEEFIDERETEVSKYKQLLHTERQNTCVLQASLENMTKSTLESSSATCWAETESGDSDRQKLQEEISQLKHEIISLKRSLRNEELRDHLYNKLKHDYWEKVGKNKTLKLHNRRLLYKVECLLKEIKFKEEMCRTARLRLYQAQCRDDELSFQLSPQKYKH